MNAASLGILTLAVLPLTPTDLLVAAIGAFVLIVISAVLVYASRYKRCPSDKVLVVYGKVGQGQSSLCMHGGGKFVWPLMQDCSFLSLTPMSINIPLQNALSLQNIRINVPCTFTVGVSTQASIMNNAAERLLNLPPRAIEEMAREIIFGQLRLTVASLTIEQINQDRESFLEAIRKNVEAELNKIGLNLINVNVTDITDESNYIESIGKKAAAEAVNRARVDVAEQEKSGAIGVSLATRDKDVTVSENVATAEKGKKKAEADRRIIVQQQETEATIGEAESLRNKEIRVAENLAEAEKGRKKAEADRRIYIQQQEAAAIAGENQAQAQIVESQAVLAITTAAARQRGAVAERQAEVEIQKAQAEAERARLVAEEVVRQEIEKRKTEIDAEAHAEQTRREAKGNADGVLFNYEAEAKGLRQVLDSKAAGYEALVRSCGGDAKAAATLLLVEQLQAIVTLQVEAIKNIRIDKVTVWDGAGKDGSSTANFMAGLVKSLPPLQDVARMAGVELPSFLGTLSGDDTAPAEPRTGGGRAKAAGPDTPRK